MNIESTPPTVGTVPLAMRKHFEVDERRTLQAVMASVVITGDLLVAVSTERPFPADRIAGARAEVENHIRSKVVIPNTHVLLLGDPNKPADLSNITPMVLKPRLGENQ